jgi:hypothetical protein
MLLLLPPPPPLLLRRGGICRWCAYAAAVWMASALPPDTSARTRPTRSQLVRKSNDKLNSITRRLKYSTESPRNAAGGASQRGGWGRLTRVSERCVRGKAKSKGCSFWCWVRGLKGVGDCEREEWLGRRVVKREEEHICGGTKRRSFQSLWCDGTPLPSLSFAFSRAKSRLSRSTRYPCRRDNQSKPLSLG